METPQALTVGVLARECGCEAHQIEYLIRSRQIEPIQRAGNLRVFAPEVVDMLKDELRKIEKRRA